MKFRIPTTAILISASAALSLAERAQALTYSTGDALLTFDTANAPGNGINLEVDLGPVSQFVNASGPIVFGPAQIGNVLADLTADYGANWSTRGDLNWAIAAATGLTGALGFPAKTDFVTDPVPLNWNRSSTSIQGVASAHILAVGGNYKTYSATANSTVAANVSASDSASYTSEDNGSTSYQVFGPTIDNTFANGTAGSISNFDELIPSNSGGPGINLGQFQFNNAGVLTFSIPEPASISLLAAAGGLFGMIRRRRA